MFQTVITRGTKHMIIKFHTMKNFKDKNAALFLQSVFLINFDDSRLPLCGTHLMVFSLNLDSYQFNIYDFTTFELNLHSELVLCLQVLSYYKSIVGYLQCGVNPLDGYGTLLLILFFFLFLLPKNCNRWILVLALLCWQMHQFPDKHVVSHQSE